MRAQFPTSAMPTHQHSGKEDGRKLPGHRYERSLQNEDERAADPEKHACNTGHTGDLAATTPSVARPSGHPSALKATLKNGHEVRAGCPTLQKVGGGSASTGNIVGASWSNPPRQGDASFDRWAAPWFTIPSRRRPATQAFPHDTSNAAQRAYLSQRGLLTSPIARSNLFTSAWTLVIGHLNRDDLMKTMDRLGALSGAAYFVLANVAIAVENDPGLPDAPTGQEVLDSWGRLASNPLAQAAISLELLAFVAWMVFIGYVCWRVRDAGWLAAAALVGGIVEIAVKIGSDAPLVTGYVLRAEISPEQALVLSQIGLVSFMVDLLPAGLFVLCAAAAAFKTQELGRVLVWSGVVIGAGNIIVAVVTGINIGQSGFSPSFLLVLLWELVVSVYWGFFRSPAKKLAAAATPQTS